jgi:hypothetical protein
MKPRTVFFTLLMLAGMLTLPAFASGRRGTGSGCNPNGNQFDLEPLVNPPALTGQANGSVGFILGRGLNGVDLVVGVAVDARVLTPGLFYDGFYLPAYYVQRANSNCAADFEGGVPVTRGSGDFPTATAPQVAADPAHDAFFMAYSVFKGGENYAMSIAKSTSANLLNGTNCPNGTQNNPNACWNLLVDANPLPFVSNYGNTSIAVDQRTQGTGAGDVYVVASSDTFTDPGEKYQIALMACTNSTLNCSINVIASGHDKTTFYPEVQVRPDGGITISYTDIVFKKTLIPDYQIKFVNCTPQGAPNPPTCSAPTLVTDAKLLGIPPGDEMGFGDVAYPWHVDRLEADGKTVTNFLIYDECAVSTKTARNVGHYLCSKAEVVIASSTDGGNTWSSFLPVSPNTPGQQFLGNIALDESTGTVNIAYYSTQNDPMQLRTQVFLAQVLPGQTTVGPISQITSTLLDNTPGCTVQQDAQCSYYVGVAAAGTGKKGQSHVYIHFPGSTNNGSFNGLAFPLYTNTLTQFDY